VALGSTQDAARDRLAIGPYNIHSRIQTSAKPVFSAGMRLIMEWAHEFSALIIKPVQIE
jgi:hypothetical protein